MKAPIGRIEIDVDLRDRGTTWDERQEVAACRPERLLLEPAHDRRQIDDIELPLHLQAVPNGSHCTFHQAIVSAAPRSTAGAGGRTATKLGDFPDSPSLTG